MTENKEIDDTGIEPQLNADELNFLIRYREYIKNNPEYIGDESDFFSKNRDLHDIWSKSDRLNNVFEIIDWKQYLPERDIKKEENRKFDSISLDELDTILSSTIVQDRYSKLITFIGSLLTYTDQDQLGIAFQAGSSTGKSHIALETMNYFPIRDRIELDYATPKAFFHEGGQTNILIDDELFPIISKSRYVRSKLKIWDINNPKPESGIRDYENRRNDIKKLFRSIWDEIEKINLIDLHQKLLVFKDMPHDELLRHLRPMISHDRRLYKIKITDKSTSGSNRTKSVVILGFPTFLFCSARYSQDEQERTRVFILSPETTQEKLKESVDMIFDKLSNRDDFNKRLNENEARNNLIERIEAIKQANIREIFISDKQKELLKEKIIELRPTFSPKFQRDIQHIIALCKGCALLNLWNRERKGDILCIDDSDIDMCIELYTPIAEANDYGIPKQVYDFFLNIKDELDTLGLSKQEIGTAWYNEFKERLGYRRIEDLIHLLINVNLITSETDPNDKRRVLYFSHDREIKEVPKETPKEKPPLEKQSTDDEIGDDVIEL